jgi:streptogramin lyase
VVAADTEAARQAAAQLGVLADNLAGRGFTAQITQAGTRACVAVTNRSVPQLSEVVNVAPADDGTWWFWWPWSDRIAPVTDVDAAAFKIAYVLTGHAGG